MIVKELKEVLAKCPPESDVSICVKNGITMTILPANTLRVLTTEEEGETKRNFVVITEIEGEKLKQ